ncbi:minichromosome maintenance protein MCM [Candidatus Woesearchaeota archaeon]|nr:minichromosome maintenance protein MCM [Candidatus Woesearchaeota archaeon]
METSDQLERFRDFFESYKERIHEEIAKGGKSVLFDFNELLTHDPELADLLLEDPENLLKAAEISLDNLDLPSDILKVRFNNLPLVNKLRIRDIRSVHLDKFIAVEGLVRQTSDVRPQVTSAKFECPSCGNTMLLLQIDTQFREPSRCSCGRRGKFRLIHKDLIDAQRVVLEESPETLEGGEQPKRLAIFLKGDLVEPKMERRTAPGTRVKITGVVKEVAMPLRTGGHSTRYDLVMESNYIEPIEETFEEINITKKEEEEILELSKDPRIYQRLVASVAPSIYGHEDIKAALILQLMGGVQKIHEDGTKRRGDMHVLLIGDPGVSKSQLLQFISKIAPKARLVSGKGASSAGLTATVVKDEFLRGWALEAGAFVLANGGFAIIDEMDKINQEDTSALHQALEQQIITIAKANIQATLKAQTTLLAAANPKLGRFDPYLPIASQINMPSTLINRFDLIFPIRDIPSREFDTKVATHVLMLQQKPEDLKAEFSPEFLKKYISYARQKIKPMLTKEAVEEIKDFYVNLRNMPSLSEEGLRPIPISARQLEALVRLAEGSARVRLSKKVAKKDAQMAIETLKRCLMQVGFDPESGQLDIDRISTGIPTSQRSKIVKIQALINELTKKVGKRIPIDDIIMEASEQGISEEQVNEALELLKRDGTIYQPQPNIIEKI